MENKSINNEKSYKRFKMNIYRMVQMEYDFLVNHWLSPIPEIHWLDGIKLDFNFK